MKAIISALLLFFYSSQIFSQLVLSGSGTSTSVANNAPAIMVDNAITITGSGSIDAARVSVSTNFSPGDVLGCTASLPSGVTASYNSSTGVLTFTGSATAAQYESLLRTVTFNTSAASTSQRTITFNLGSAISFSGNGHFYEYVSGSYSWTSAKTGAAGKSFYGLQGYLATITSQAENDFIQQKLSADGWIGASDDYSYINAATGTSTYANQAASEGKWYWVAGPSGEIGTQFSNGNNSPSSVSGRYMNWNSGEPNNSGSTEHYGEIYSSGSSGKWNDLPNTSLLGYVVEYGGMAGDPVVNLSISRNVTMIATSLQTTGTSNAYALHASATYVDNAILVYSSGSITDAKVTISSNFKNGDVLSYTGSLPSVVTASYNSSTGVLSFSGTATASQWQTLFRTVQFNSSSNVIANRNITFSVGNLVAGSNGHFYEYVSTTSNWTTAKTNAAARTYMGLHGYLATITSQAENDFIQQKLSADAWIGASDDYSYINAATGTSTYANQSASEGKWYWVTGPVGETGIQFSNGNTSPVAVNSNFMNWNSGEPNNSGSTEHYAEFYASGVNPGKWNDLSNTGSLGYVTEYGGLATDPLLYLSASRVMSIASILPVTGLQFSVAKNNEGVQLKWSTYTEINSDHFDILYSQDAVNYISIGSIAAAGNSDHTINYEWLHRTPSAGKNYYKIKETDIDGRAIISEVKWINNGSIQVGLSPNPVQSQFLLTYPYIGKSTQLIIRNNLGALISKKEINSENTIVNAATLAKGMYIAEIIEENRVVARLSFIKQ